MKTLDFIKIVERGLGPVITMNQATSEIVMGATEYSHYLEEGMLGRVKLVSDQERINERYRTLSTYVWFYVDLFEFIDYNKKFETNHGWINRSPSDLKKYEIFQTCTTYVDPSTRKSISRHEDLKEFKFDKSIPENKLIIDYLESGTEQSFTRWMEDQLADKAN